MVSPPPNARRYFLPWDQPLLPQAVSYLAAAWPGDGPLDLSHLMVVVPTRQSGRRLREALAAYAATRAQAAFPPAVITPDALVAADAATDVASRLETLLTWTEVFLELDLDAFREVFPIDPPERAFGWASRLAQEFTRLQGILAEAGLRLEDVPEKAGDNFAEAERWRQIAELERLHAAKLAALDRRDGAAAKIARASSPVLPGGIERIVVLGVPDPVPIALRALEVHAATRPVDVVVFAPESEAAMFDAWGRPLAEAWAARELALAGFEQHVQLLADPAAQAERVVAVVRGYQESEGVVAVGVADAEVLPLLETGLRREALAGFNPEGRARRGDGFFQLLTSLSILTADDSFAAIASLARCPDFLEFLRRRNEGKFSAAAFLSLLDKLHTAYLPPDLAEARRHAPHSEELVAIANARATLTSGTFPKNVATALGTIFNGRRFDLSRSADALAAEAIEAWADVMHELADIVPRFHGVKNSEWWDLALRLYGDEKHTDDKPAGAVELQGWLELLWEDAPHLVVAGLNDGRVPDAVVGDAFLPEGLRERLGLKTNAARFARDGYLLQALAACRAQGGRINLLVGKTSAAGDPLRPSRLLLRCADAELPRRIRFLFGPVASASAGPSWQRAWCLHPERVAAPERVAVTALRAWLDCPFRFYLSRVLRMQPVDPSKTELDEQDFGTLCHAALEAMGGAPALRDCTDAPVIREFLLAALEREATKRLGSELTLPLVVQLESARQRLSRVAEIQASARAEGWVTVHVEKEFEIEIDGLKIRGKIDRIDRHESTGAIRVLDYKTSDKPVNPAEAHLRTTRRNETSPDFARLADGEREFVWKDLQLPLYLRALAGEFSGEISCGYFNLPKASTETGIALWESYTLELAESAWRCASGVAAAIRAGEFWPPNENVRPDYDDFASLFHGGVADSVAWEESAR